MNLNNLDDDRYRTRTEWPKDVHCRAKIKPCFHCNETFEGPEGLILTCCDKCKKRGHKIENNCCTACRINFEGKLPFTGYN